MVDGDFVPRHPAQLINDVSYLDAVGAIERDVFMGVNNEEGALFVNFAFFYNTSDTGYTEEEEERLQDFFQVG